MRRESRRARTQLPQNASPSPLGHVHSGQGPTEARQAGGFSLLSLCGSALLLNSGDEAKSQERRPGLSLCVVTQETRDAWEGRHQEAPSFALCQRVAGRPLCATQQGRGQTLLSAASHTCPAPQTLGLLPTRLLPPFPTCRVFSNQHSGALASRFTEMKAQGLRRGPTSPWGCVLALPLPA